MIADRIIVRRFRLILDGILVFALIVAIFLSIQPTKADAELQASALSAEAVSSRALQLDGRQVEPSASDNPPIEGVTIDNNTLAALIAAQNAALTPPQYLIGLPIIQR